MFLNNRTLLAKNQSYYDWRSEFTSVPGELIPLDVNGTVLWARSDLGIVLDESGNVSAWNDISGNGNNFSQETANLRPIYNSISSNLMGRPTVQFTAAGNHAMKIAKDTVLEDGTGDGFTIVTAIHQDALQTPAQNFLAGRSAADSTELRAATEINAADEVGFYDNNWLGCGTDATTGDQTLVWRLTNGAVSAGTCEVFSNGVSIGTAVGTTGVSGFADHDSSSGNRLVMGAYRAENQEWLNAEVAEVIVYNRKLTDNEILNIHNYMSTRYGL